MRIFFQMVAVFGLPLILASRLPFDTVFRHRTPSSAVERQSVAYADFISLNAHEYAQLEARARTSWQLRGTRSAVSDAYRRLPDALLPSASVSDMPYFENHTLPYAFGSCVVGTVDVKPNIVAMDETWPAVPDQSVSERLPRGELLKLPVFQLPSVKLDLESE